MKASVEFRKNGELVGGKNCNSLVEAEKMKKEYLNQFTAYKRIKDGITASVSKGHIFSRGTNKIS